MEELPDERKSRYMGQNELSAYDADVLVSNRELLISMMKLSSIQKRIRKQLTG